LRGIALASSAHQPRHSHPFLWRDIAENLARFIKLAFLGLAVYIGIDWLFAGVGGVVFSIAYVSGHPFHSDSIGWSIWFITPVWVSSLLIGRMLARRAPGRELAACLVYAVLVSIYNLVPMLGDNSDFSALLCILAVLAGAAWGRHRTGAATQLKLI
jgi:hypothetical protein